MDHGSTIRPAAAMGPGSSSKTGLDRCNSSKDESPERIDWQTQIPGGHGQNVPEQTPLNEMVVVQSQAIPRLNNLGSSEQSLSASFSKLCATSNLPGKAIAGTNKSLQALLKENLSTINDIFKNVQDTGKTAVGTGNFVAANLSQNDPTDIHLPMSITGKSRLTTGKMGYDMELSKALLQEPFYQELLSVKGEGLEIGAGYGELCLRILEKTNVSRLDCNEPQIAQLLTILARVNSDQQSNPGKLYLINSPFPESFAAECSSKYDFIICHRVFSVTPANVASDITEAAYRLLKPGGRLFILSLCDQHPGFQKNIGESSESQLANNNGLIEVAANTALPDQVYNLPENITFITRESFEEYLQKTGFIIDDTSYPSTTRVAGNGNEVEWKRNIAFIVQKPGTKN